MRDIGLASFTFLNRYNYRLAQSAASADEDLLSVEKLQQIPLDTLA
jgi:hypothetical protein